SGQAYETVIGQADIPLNDLRKDDELVLNDLLLGTLIDTMDITLRPRRDLAVKMFKDKFSREQLTTAFAKPARISLSSVRVLPESLRHRTPREVFDDFTQLVDRRVIIDPRMAQWEMLVQGDVVVDSRMAEAKRQQEMENSMILAGQEVPIEAGQDHWTSLRVIEHFQSSPRWHSYKKEQQQSINIHWAGHKQAEMDLAQWGQAMMAEQQVQGSAPAQAAGQQSGIGPEAMTA
ncbi:hypothetical protein LCGC14_1895050, partial [marine sediment metagenome]